MRDLIVITLEPIAVQELDEILIEGDAAKALEYLQRVVKPQVDRGTKKGKGFFEDEPEPFFG
jgi:hypothetical protein